MRKTVMFFSPLTASIQRNLYKQAVTISHPLQGLTLDNHGFYPSTGIIQQAVRSL